MPDTLEALVDQVGSALENLNRDDTDIKEIKGQLQTALTALKSQLQAAITHSVNSQNGIQLQAPELDMHMPIEDISLSDLVAQTVQQGIPAHRPSPAEAAATIEALVQTLPTIEEKRYEVEEMLGGGGQGSVRGVFDRYLQRVVALKAMHMEQITNPSAVKAFLTETILTAQLDHPGIVAIHDLGLLPTGAPSYTMKKVQGRSLRQLINALRRGDAELEAYWTRRRRIDAILQVAHIIGYAHDRGVVHRDLKPPNIMLGDYGEVQILDWGVAKILGLKEDVQPEDETAVHLPPDWMDTTLSGVIKGTLTYMAPEQASGDPDDITTASDVFALGALLYEVLLLRPARKSLSSEEMIPVVRHEPIGSAEECRRKEGLAIPVIPEELDDIIARCCALDMQKRYQNGEEVAKALQAYLDGEARRAQSLERTRQAESMAQAAADAELEMERLQQQMHHAEHAIPPWAPLEDRRRVWQLEDQVHQARTQHDTAFANSVALYTQALGDDPENRVARKGLATLYMERLREAEEMGRRRDARLYEAQIRRMDDGSLEEALKGEGSLELITSPPGADVWLYRLTTVDRVYRRTEGRRLGRSPMKVMDLPMGRYVAVIGPGSGQEVRCPVLIRRQGHWVTRISLEYDIPDNYVYIPGGPFIFGGDRTATGSGPRESIHLDDFAISRLPVTCEEYLLFLNDLARDRGQAYADRHAPRTTSETGAGKPLWHPKKGGGYRLPGRDRTGGLWGPDLPVRHVSREDAEAYALWLSAQENRSYRLPREQEWEKAARGVDARWYPWGDLFDPAFCKMRDTRPGPPEPEPAGSVPLDESPYGVRDMAGNIMEWCATAFDRHGLMGVVKGGFWLSAAESCRAARRFGYKPGEPSPFAGFRMVVDLSGG